jgi:hypothetical protein
MDFDKLEDLLGIQKGSAERLSREELIPELVKGVDNKTKELELKFKKSGEVQKTEEPASSLSLEKLEEDRKKIIEETVLLYEIGKRLLMKLEESINDKINPTDKDFAAAGALLSSVSNSLDKLKNINREYRQEEEMRRMSLLSESSNEDGTMDLGPDAIAKFIEDHRKKTQKTEEMESAQDAIIVDGEPEGDSEEDSDEEESV